MVGMAEAWLDEIFNPDLTGDIINYHLRFNGYPGFNNYFDKSWREADECLWEKARKYDPPGKGGKGKVARLFGLYDVRDRNRPCWASKRLLLALEDSQAQSKSSNVVKPAKDNSFVSSIPIAGPLDSAVQSGHAFVVGASANGDVAKEKFKTRGPSVAVVDEPKGAPADALDEEEIPVPELLPGNFKLPKKIHKVQCTHLLNFVTLPHRYISDVPTHPRK